MDVDALRHQLREAPFNFLSAVSSFTLPDFDKKWHSLCEDVQTASRLSLLNDEDISLIHPTATLLATLGELFLSTDEETSQSTAQLMTEVEDVFARLTISDIERPSSPTLPAYAGSPWSQSRSTPSYILPAYSWILRNIHNPYPSKITKEGIARDAGRSLRDISDWFKDVRRHIGWVAMCKNHFQGSRALTVQAAKDVYLQTNASRLTSSEIVLQFEAIRVRLCNMYPMADDNGNHSDSTDDSFTPYSLSSRSSSGQSYSPWPRSSSSTPSLVFSSDEEDNHSLASFGLDDAPPSLGKRKNLTEEDELRPLKRNRSGFLNVADGMVKDVTPAASTALSFAMTDSPLPLQCTFSRKRRLSIASTDWEGTSLNNSALLPTCDPRPPSRAPKRRLSVSDSQPVSKRPCLPLAVGPRKQAVSTPIPIAYQTTPDADDWFRTFELPDTSLSVELFNWDLVVGNDAFPYNSLFDNILQTDSQDSSNVTPLSDAYPSTSLDLSVSSAVNPSALDISSTFTEPPPMTAPSYTLSPEPFTASATPVFDFDVFLSTVNAKPAEPGSLQESLSPYTELSLDDSIDIFGDLVVP